MDNEKDLFDFVNLPFAIKFNGKDYQVKKASLEKAVLYQAKIRQLVTDNDPAVDLKIAAYCLYLVLHEIDPSITEEYIFQNTPADIDTLAVIERLGFMSPQKRMNVQNKN